MLCNSSITVFSECIKLESTFDISSNNFDKFLPLTSSNCNLNRNGLNLIMNNIIKALKLALSSGLSA